MEWWFAINAARLSKGIRALRIESDSELLVKQMRGQYKVKSEDLRPLFERAKKMSQSLESFRIDHIYRDQNAEADLLANQAMDEANGVSTPVAAPKPVAPPAKRAHLVRARFRSGIIYPLEDLDIPDGAEVEIAIRLAPKKS
jgi:ribonuclease HI